MPGRRLPDDQAARVRAELQRLLRQYTQIELAAKLGYAQSHLSKVAFGEPPTRPGLELAQAIATVRGVPLFDLLHGHHVRTTEERLEAIEDAQAALLQRFEELLARLGGARPSGNGGGEGGSSVVVPGVLHPGAARANRRQDADHDTDKPRPRNIAHEVGRPDRRRKAKP